jgi:hypothetical protein
MAIVTAIALLADTLAGTVPPPETRKEIMAMVGKKLADEETARYRWPKFTNNTRKYCVFVNAKNAYGAYTGYELYFILGGLADGPKGDGKFHPGSVTSPFQFDGAFKQLVRSDCAKIGISADDIPPRPEDEQAVTPR